MKVETFQAMGAVPVKDGIVFSMETTKKPACFFIKKAVKK